MTQSTLTEYQSSGSEPYKDKELLRRLYIDEELTQKEISDRFGCSPSTVSKYLREFEIPTRLSEPERRKLAPANFYMHDSKYEAWRTSVDGKRKTMFVHRLLAIHKYGFDAVCDMQVHHINDIPWDNREENIELMTIGEHSTHHHTKVEGIDRLRVAELYENGDTSYRRLHDALDYDVTWYTLMMIHKEFYGE